MLNTAGGKLKRSVSNSNNTVYLWNKTLEQPSGFSIFAYSLGLEFKFSLLLWLFTRNRHEKILYIKGNLEQ